jgi:hypothetical protein
VQDSPQNFALSSEKTDRKSTHRSYADRFQNGLNKKQEALCQEITTPMKALFAPDTQAKKCSTFFHSKKSLVPSVAFGWLWQERK